MQITFQKYLINQYLKKKKKLNAYNGDNWKKMRGKEIQATVEIPESKKMKTCFQPAEIFKSL